MSSGISNDDRVLALFSESSRLSWEEVKARASLQRLALMQTLTRLVDKGILRREKVNHGRATATVYFEIRRTL